MRRVARGFGNHEYVGWVALSVLVLAIAIPLVQVTIRAVKHGISLPKAIDLALLALVSFVGLILIALVLLAVLTLPIAWLVKVKHKRSEPFRDVWGECFGGAIGLAWASLILIGGILMIRDWIVVPIAQLFRHG